ncbi:transmembrane protein, putative (macronuclear) [Tetrahymena thermophila SB210]|uniref:Transmembrane protein, putative n=1 Tax=Tetrahymena thermophila (strain SB210) TaxID=312017 RepID=W7XK32_TETTS|nr:transmembrane protein, putative [Tetrahymena thermophila SB210]EWS74554.1 transmembrane protein, putative [Tetrahymena thermophila SB210]|eukprot:XP_012652928.1 transmembrane protein, putative [Tetrahymena thermophila SB210]
MSQIETNSWQSQANNMMLGSQSKQQLQGLKLIFKISILSLVIFGTILAVNLRLTRDQSVFSHEKNLTGNANGRFLNSLERKELRKETLKEAQNNQVDVAYQTFYELINGLNQQILDYLNISYITEYSINKLQDWTNIFYRIYQDFPISAIEWMYEDQNYGFKYNPQIWMDGYLEQQNNQINEKSISIFLINYFKLDYYKMDKFWSYMYNDFYGSILISEEYLIRGTFNCTQSNEQEYVKSCLLAQQWVDLNLGYSIANLNKTMLIEPEIAAFQKGYFKQHVNSSSLYQDIKFAQEWAVEVTKINQNTSHSLVDKDNLSFLFLNGQNYDETQNEIYLVEISERFLINQYYFGEKYLDATYLFWQYAIYMVDIFSELRNYKDGGFEVYKKSQFDSQKLSSQFQVTSDNLAVNIIEALMLENYKSKNITDCKSFTYQLQQAEHLCKIQSFNNFDLQTMRTIYECKMYMLYSPQCEQYNFIYNFDVVNQVIKEVDLQMYNQYQCISKIEKCSYYEIAAKQWYNLEVIRKLPDAAVPYLPKGRDSVAQWIPNLQPYEWGYYVEKYGQTFSQPPANLTYNQTSQLLGYNILFSNNRLTQIFVIDSSFSQNYFFKDPSQLRSYFNWLPSDKIHEVIYQQQ